MRAVCLAVLTCLSVACGNGAPMPDAGSSGDLAGADFAIDCTPIIYSVNAVTADMDVTVVGANLTMGSKNPYFFPVPGLKVLIDNLEQPPVADGKDRLVIMPAMNLYDMPVTVQDGCGSFTFTMPWNHI